MNLKVGDVICQRSGVPFRSGSVADPFAVVISIDPLAWVSEGGDMLWRTNLDPTSVEVVRTATKEELNAAMRRYPELQKDKNERIVRKMIQYMTTDSLPEVAYRVLLGMLSESQASRLNEIVDVTDGDFYIKDRVVEMLRVSLLSHVLDEEDVPESLVDWLVVFHNRDE